MSNLSLAAASAVDDIRRANLRRLLAPKSIAVVGASADPSKAGSQAMKSLSTFPGCLVGVHPREKEIQGFPCYPDFASLPEPVDLAVLAIPAQHCVKAAADAAARGVGGIFIISGGFGETGEAGAALQAQLAEICRKTGLRLLGPNTSGFINPHNACVASFVPGVDKLPKGNVAVIAQSGGVNLSISFLVERLGAGLSLAVGLGNAVDVGSADVLEMLADDPTTAAIALHLEGVPNGRELFDTLKRVTPRKPVVALVAGKADIGEFAVSHTGNLMGSHQRTVSALTQAGVVVVGSTEDLAQAAVVLAHQRLAPKERNAFGLVTGQAGPGLLIVDGLKSAGVDVPELSPASIEKVQALLPPMTFVKNPVDTGRPGPGFPLVVQHVAEDERIDAVLVFGLSEPAVLDPSAALKPAFVSTGKPIVFGTLGMAEDLVPALEDLRRDGVPAVQSPERLVLSGVALDTDSRAQWRLARLSGEGTVNVGQQLVGPFNEDRSKELLGTYGIDSPGRRLCVGRAAALEAFQQLRKPVVVKIAADDVPHKTEVGGVFLDVRDLAGLNEALDSIARIPTSTPDRVLVEEMAPLGVELIVGAVRDSSWGPCVVIGLGGILAEAVADSAVRLAPLAEEDVSEMLESLRGKKLLDGFRNLPRCDRAAIRKVALALGRLLIEHPEISEVEINPLRVNTEGALALDALVVLAPST
ncbi:acetate--CoA ligase family protein [Variovorax sp. efr-133-TYG-130]|uniref:acetate--CoA ligase family protein n=1 Tax=Variovorax sp. efr-133-TYG-130 TaxID=3040327 RepID=UPI0025554E19|nr:acetate--CoA ligase family protein [Variovorax sp. efr-133-TYG-130]